MPRTIPAPPDVAAPPADASQTSSGLATKVISPGTGTRHPRASSRVKVHYSGWTTDGQMFDSSVARDEPISFGLNQVIPGWTEGVQLMVEGETRRLWIPERLAYGGQRGAPQGMLVFDVELIRIES
jgi:FKBP-type peptidyl-prolyl cis-trans isomerase